MTKPSWPGCAANILLIWSSRAAVLLLRSDCADWPAIEGEQKLLREKVRGAIRKLSQKTPVPKPIQAAVAAPPPSRDDFIKSMFDTSGYGLEVGPSYNPLLPKSHGFNVEIVDHATAEELRAKYAFLPTAAQSIEEVDFVSDGRPLSEVIGATSRYDFVFASHVIEHVTDIVAFLNDCSELLKENGKLVLAVPDKRFCFDLFRPLSSVGQAVEAHLSHPTRHSTGALFDHLAYFVERDGNSVWIDPGTSKAKLQHPLSEAFDLAVRASQSSEYYDAHAWRFTPASFHFIVRCLNALRLVRFGVDTISRFEGAGFKHEFYVLMSAKSYVEEFDAAERADFLTRIEADLAVVSGAQTADVDLARAKADLAEAEAAIVEIRNSRSWRITEPVRLLARLLRGQ